jgi:hypothetical protein
MKSARKLLEEDLNLQTGVLYEHKSYIAQLIDNALKVEGIEVVSKTAC